MPALNKRQWMVAALLAAVFVFGLFVGSGKAQAFENDEPAGVFFAKYGPKSDSQILSVTHDPLILAGAVPKIGRSHV